MKLVVFLIGYCYSSQSVDGKFERFDNISLIDPWNSLIVDETGAWAGMSHRPILTLEKCEDLCSQIQCEMVHFFKGTSSSEQKFHEVDISYCQVYTEKLSDESHRITTYDNLDFVISKMVKGASSTPFIIGRVLDHAPSDNSNQGYNRHASGDGPNRSDETPTEFDQQSLSTEFHRIDNVVFNRFPDLQIAPVMTPTDCEIMCKEDNFYCPIVSYDKSTQTCYIYYGNDTSIGILEDSFKPRLNTTTSVPHSLFEFVKDTPMTEYPRTVITYMRELFNKRTEAQMLQHVIVTPIRLALTTK